MLNLHPAPGMGVFLPANWTLPQNPLESAFGLGRIVTGIYKMTDNGVVAEIVAKRAAAEDLQKNPNGPVGLSCGSPCSCEVGLCGLGIIDCGGLNPCPCESGSCGGSLVTGLHGLGGLNGTLDDILGSVTGSMGNWQTWAMVAAGVAALVMFTGGGGSQRSAELAAARAQYKSKVASIRASRPRRYQKYV